MKSPSFNILLFSLVFFNSLKFGCASGGNVKKSVDDRDDNGDTNDESKDESLDIPLEPNEQQTGTTSVNVTCTRRSNTLMHEIKPAAHKQFPFMASIMSQQNDHLCSGTVVSNGLILTSATCTQQPMSHVLINATKAKKDETTVALNVIKTEKFPTFATGEPDKDVGLIYTEKFNNSLASKIRLSNFTSTRNIVDMEVFGFGLNAEVGQTKELQYIGIENRLTAQEAVPVHPTSTSDMMLGYIDCIDTKILTCFKDSGGPSIFSDELIGIVVKGDDKCFKQITATYSVNKIIANVLPTYIFKAWLAEKIKKNEEHDLVTLVAFPYKPVPSRRQMTATVRAKKSATSVRVTRILFLFPLVFLI